MRDEIRAWWEEKLRQKSNVQRQELENHVRDYSDEDWEATYELNTTWDLKNRSEREIADLQLAEQRILKALPPLERHGVRYAAPWTLGIRLQAARKLWGGSHGDFTGKTTVTTLDSETSTQRSTEDSGASKGNYVRPSLLDDLYPPPDAGRDARRGEH